jgi:hypothetical protein
MTVAVPTTSIKGGDKFKSLRWEWGSAGKGFMRINGGG